MCKFINSKQKKCKINIKNGFNRLFRMISLNEHYPKLVVGGTF